MSFGIMRLADFALGVDPCGVKIPECHPWQVERDIEIRQHPLDEEFRMSIWIDRKRRCQATAATVQPSLCHWGNLGGDQIGENFVSVP